MREQLVTFETAKLAREKGFYHSSCEIKSVPDDLYHEVSDSSRYRYAYLNGRNKNEVELVLPFVFKKQNLDYVYLCDAPTQSLLQKWLREIHDIDVYVIPNGARNKSINKRLYHPILWIRDENQSECSSAYSYEEALEIGLQEALKLI